VGVEIERKYLIADLGVVAGRNGVRIAQGYLAVDPERTVRVRIVGLHAYLTVKGITSADGTSRHEFEYEIPLSDAEQMLDRLALRPFVEKTRYRVVVGALAWEIDVFVGANEGLVVAEVELPSRSTEIALPEWVGKEVTGDPRYYNANLVLRPYSRWDEPGPG
jgi:adenylate cyclase